jgi:hypothetical protein
MSQSPTSDPPPVILKANGRVGLFVHVDEAETEELRDCLTEDNIVFSFNPPEAEHLAQPGKAIFVFGRRHPRVVAEWLELCGEEVVIDPDVVITEDLYHPPVKQLLSLGELRRDAKLDYAALGLSRNDVPALIRMATDYQLHDGPQDSPVVWSPVHAWRALAQLRAEEAIAPLVELFRRADDDMDDWVSEDLPHALAQFGAVALAPLTDYLGDATHGDWSRVAAAEAIGFVGKEQPDTRAECVLRLSAQLERFAEQSETLNAFLISPLLDLRAVEAMPVIERAFASGRVDESVPGDVEDVEIEFGLKTKRAHPPKPNALTIMGEQFRNQWKAAGLPLPEAHDNFPEPEAEPPALSLPYIAPLKVGRNEPCPCGSGKKFKKCCGG